MFFGTDNKLYTGELVDVRPESRCEALFWVALQPADELDQSSSVGRGVLPFLTR